MKISQSILKKHIYYYSAKNSQGQSLQGEIEAVSANLAKYHLKQKNIFVTTIRKKNIFDLIKINKKISTLEITFFFRQLATLITAEIPLLQSFNLLEKSQKNHLLSALIKKIKAEIEAGNGLGSALKKFPYYFDALTCQLIQMGEHSGTLNKILNRIAHTKESTLKLKTKLYQALFYPVTVLIVASLVTLIMLIAVVPRFADLFQSMHSQLPAFTRSVIYFSHFIRMYFWLAIFPLTGMGIFYYFVKRSLRLQDIKDAYLLKIPTVKKIILARITRGLSMTFSAGIPIIESLKMLAPLTGNRLYSQAVLALRHSIEKGQQLHAAMQLTILFPPLLTQMVKIGEESGMLTAMLDKTAELYETDIDHFFTTFGHLLEPLIILVLGVLIGGLVIAMYLPIFKLGTVI